MTPTAIFVWAVTMLELIGKLIDSIKVEDEPSDADFNAAKAKIEATHTKLLDKFAEIEGVAPTGADMPRTFTRATPDYLYADTTAITAAPMTMSCWGRSDDVANYQTAVYFGDGNAANDFWAVSFAGADADNINFYAKRATLTNASSTGTYTANVWYHGIGVEVSATERYAGIDGVLGSADTTSKTPAAGSVDRFGIGANTDDAPDSGFSGSLFWVAWWNTDLDASDVLRLGQGVDPIFVRRDALVFYAPLMADEDQDKVGGLALTAAGTPTVSNDFPATMIRAAPRGRGRDRHRFT